MERLFLDMDTKFTSRIALAIALVTSAHLAHSSYRFDFAHAYLGLGVHHVPSGKSYILNGTSFEDYEIAPRQNLRLLIGGLHFWN